jgi:hypothetical protein
MLGLKHKLKDGVHYFEGAIDEHANLKEYTATHDNVIRWNLRGVTLINSLGIRLMMRFIKDLGTRSIEFYDCPTPFLEAASIIPGMVGAAGTAHRVKSVYLPMRCTDFHQFNASVPTKDISFADGIAMPVFDCPTCKMPLDPDLELELEDLLYFLSE